MTIEIDAYLMRHFPTGAPLEAKIDVLMLGCTESGEIHIMAAV